MKEREFQSWVVDVATRFGWRSWHVPFPVRPVGDGKFIPEPRAKGLPDLILLHDDPPRLIFAELKGDGGRLSDEQAEFLRLARLLTSALRDHQEAVRAVLVASGADPVRDSIEAVPVGVYVWQPGMESQVETVLRSKVMA